MYLVKQRIFFIFLELSKQMNILKYSVMYCSTLLYWLVGDISEVRGKYYLNNEMTS